MIKTGIQVGSVTIPIAKADERLHASGPTLISEGSVHLLRAVDPGSARLRHDLRFFAAREVMNA